MTITGELTLAQRLLGTKLANGWRVIEKAPQPLTGPRGEPRSPGQFSRPYIVEKEGRRAFLKAIDMAALMQEADATEKLTVELNQYSFERKVLELCRDRHMDRVVQILDAGEYRPEGGTAFDIVPYIIFELAESDARRFIQMEDKQTVAWGIRLLHHVAVALSQLHKAGLSHQDVKLANIFDFGNSINKLGDLGRAVPRLTALAAICPHLEDALAGDPTYAPPELVYDAPPSNWDLHRLGADIYLLGSLITALFLGSGMTTLVQKNLAPEHRANGWVVGNAWGGSYFEVLIYVRAASEKVFDFLENELRNLDPKIRNELVMLARELCDPDPERRGDAKSAIHGRNADLVRIVSRLNSLAERASIYARGIHR